MIKKLAVAAAGATMFAAPAWSQETIKIGFITTLTTPAAVIGIQQKNAVELAVEHIGGQIAGMDVEILFEDDAFNPQTGRTASEKLANDPDVRFVTGYIWSHVLLASTKVVLDAGKFMISANAGASQMSGESCNENFFSTSWENSQIPRAMGEVMNQRGVKSIYVMAPNYAAGKNMVEGVEATFDGEILGRDMTRWGADAQLDFSAELAKARASGAEALFAFYPGRAGGAFVKQYEQSGLADSTELFTVFTMDGVSLPRFQEANLTGVLGTYNTNYWSPDMDNEQNQRFVADYLAKYGEYPAHYAAQAYDLIFMIKSAVEAAGGDLDDMDAIREGLRAADYPSVRGDYSYGSNNYPIQNFYLREVVVDSEGRWTNQIVSTVYENMENPYIGQCPM